MIPLMHDFGGETVLVFGGGPVGARKARRFAREATVIVLSPEFADDEFADAELIRSAPDPESVGDWIERVAPALAVAATDDEEVNATIEKAARDRGVLVNRADRSGERDPGSVVVPATVREDPVVVAISTGGKSPAVSRELRGRIEGEVSGAGELAELTADLRAELEAEGIDPEARREAVRTVASHPEVWKALRRGTTNPHQVVRDVTERVLEQQ